MHYKVIIKMIDYDNSILTREFFCAESRDAEWLVNLVCEGGNFTKEVLVYEKNRRGRYLLISKEEF